MFMEFNNDTPIFMQIADQIEDAILSGVFPEETQIPSTTEISVNYKLNPATALKGMNLLVDQGIIYKKRGLGMFVAEGAAERLKEKRKSRYFENYVKKSIDEAKRLMITQNELIEMIKRGYEQ